MKKHHYFFYELNKKTSGPRRMKNHIQLLLTKRIIFTFIDRTDESVYMI